MLAMSNLKEQGLDAIFSPLKSQVSRNEIPNQARLNDKVIQAKVKAALKGYPAWADNIRRATPNYNNQTQTEPTQATSGQASNLPTPNVQSTPTQASGFADRRAAAARRAQADMQVGTLPAPPKPPTYADRRADAARRAQADLRPGRPPPGDYTSSTADLIRRRQAQGLTESRFDDLYSLLESALFEQNVADPGSFSNYIEKVILFDLNNNSDFKEIATDIDKDFSNNKSAEAYQKASKLLDFIFKQQMMGKARGSSVSQGVSSVGTAHLERVVNAMNSNYYNGEELSNLVLSVFSYLKRKYPSEYQELSKDIRTSVANFQKQNTPTSKQTS